MLPRPALPWPRLGDLTSSPGRPAGSQGPGAARVTARARTYIGGRRAVCPLIPTPDPNSSPLPTPPTPAGKRSLAGLDRAGLRAALAAIDVPDQRLKMRTGQPVSWIYVRGATAFEAMSDVSKDLRARLAQVYSRSSARDRARAGVARRHREVRLLSTRQAGPRKPGSPRLRLSTSPRSIVALCASEPDRLYADVLVLLTPARNGWCAIWRWRRSLAKSSSPVTASAIRPGDRPLPLVGCRPRRKPPPGARLRAQDHQRGADGHGRAALTISTMCATPWPLSS